MTEPTARSWTDIDPADATSLNLTVDLTITAPLNENGERCPWPWEPQQLVGAPLGQYRCQYCNAMVMAGMPHLDYAPEERTLDRENTLEIAEWCGGRRAGGANELVAVDQFGDTKYARPGDTIRRDGYGVFTIMRPAVPSAADTTGQTS